MNIESLDESSLIRRAHVFAKILICLGVVITLAFLLVVNNPSSKVVATIFGFILCISGATLLAFNHARKIYHITRFIILFNIAVMANAELLSGSSAGVTWIGYLVWPPLTLLVLRDKRSYLVATVICGFLLIVMPVMVILQIFSVNLRVAPETLWIYWAMINVTFIGLNIMIFFIWRDEQKAKNLTDQAINELHSAYDELQARSAAISEALERQRLLQSQVEELQVPLIRLGNRAALLPLIGTLDTGRIKDIFTHVPQVLHDRSIKWLILDLTGGRFVNPDDLILVNDLVQTVRLLGIRISITGISPELAREIAVRPGLELQKLSQRLEDVLLPVQVTL